MRQRCLISSLLLLCSLPGCMQQLPPNDSTIEDVRFDNRESAENKATLERLMAYMEGQPRQADMDANDLTENSLLKEDTPCGYIPPETLEAAEEAWLSMEPYERIRLGAGVMDALLSSPAQLMGASMACKQQRVHSYRQLDVHKWRSMAGESFAPCEDEREDFIRTALFKRMAARIILEDIACNIALGNDMRCAAAECLRHICLDGLTEADGAWDSRYIVDALPLHNLKGSELETALFGGPAWERRFP